MDTPLVISVRGMPRSEALEARIRDAAGKLEQFQPRLTSCRVVVDQVDRHRHQGRQFRVRIVARAPGHEEVVATLQHHEDVYVAVRDAFDATRRRLEELVRERRGDVKVHAREGHGKVARLDVDEGFGFIASDEGELYFCRENVAFPDFESLQPGTEVQYLVEPAGEGLQAKRVTAGKHRFGG